MSGVIFRPPKGLGTDEEQEKLGSKIIDRWPLPKGKGPKAEANLRKLIRAIIKSYSLATARQIYAVLDNYVSLRVHHSWYTHLFSFVQEEYDRAIKDGRLALSSIKLLEQQKRIRWADRKANAEQTRKLAEALSCSFRYASMLRRDGTTIRGTAEKMAEVLGTTASDHLKERARAVRQPDLPALFLKLRVPGGTFRDFLIDDKPVMSGVAESFLSSLQELKGDEWIGLANVDTLENLIQFCKANEICAKTPPVLFDIWAEFKLWKIELISARAIRTVKENLSTESPDHRGDRL